MRAVPRDLARLRLKAEAAARVEDWTAYLDEVDALRAQDGEWWPHLWAPLAALAVHAMGDDPIPLLQEAIDGGFRQPDSLPLAEHLDSLPQWPALLAAMQQSPPSPAYEITRWPTVTYGPPLVLDRLPRHREEQLTTLLPRRSASAWATARTLLEWVTGRWDHANDHVESEDAVEVLERADAGERFACVEYSIVLSQSLNAVGIPARRVSVRTRDAHVGVGRSHVVSEAWIDDLGAWVVLDGQNGAWWGTDEQPLGLCELLARARSGAARPTMHLTVKDLTTAHQEIWWRYFHSAVSTGMTIPMGDSVVPLMQGDPEQARLVAGAGVNTHPDLAEMSTGLASGSSAPAVTFTPVHPYATAVRVDDHTIDIGEPFSLDRWPSGDHALDVRTVTPYAELRAQPLRVTRR